MVYVGPHPRQDSRGTHTENSFAGACEVHCDKMLISVKHSCNFLNNQ